jgi:uncharacterized membrane protein HdeD (DUF308 family)
MARLYISALLSLLVGFAVATLATTNLVPRTVLLGTTLCVNNIVQVERRFSRRPGLPPWILSVLW